MEAKMTNDQLERLSAFVEARLGLYFPPARWPDLERGIAAAAKLLGMGGDTAVCAERLMSVPPDADQLDMLAGCLTVGETYFFREGGSFEALTGHILPQLLAERRGRDRRLRIWSAACCTGEEPYSIAIALRRSIPGIRDWDVTILGTDVNPHFLRKAEAGVFGPWSFRDTPGWVKEQYFRPAGDREFAILPEIRRMVRFARLNLAEEVYPSSANDTHAMDVIFCRNVLMYFAASGAERVIRRLSRAQAAGGWLIVSPAELTHVPAGSYVPVNVRGAIVYRKLAATHERDRAAEGIATPAPPATTVAREATTPSVMPPDRGPHDDRRPRGDHERTAELRRMARAFANQGDLAHALECCERCIAIDKLDAACHYLRGIVLQEQGAESEAVVALRTALYVDPGFAVAHVALGHIARRRGMDDEVKKHFTNALRLLRGYRKDEIVPESEGIAAGRFAEIIESLLAGSETSA